MPSWRIKGPDGRVFDHKVLWHTAHLYACMWLHVVCVHSLPGRLSHSKFFSNFTSYICSYSDLHFPRGYVIHSISLTQFLYTSTFFLITILLRKHYQFSLFYYISEIISPTVSGETGDNICYKIYWVFFF